MYGKLIAIAAAFGVVFALGSASLAETRSTTPHAKKVEESKIKRPMSEQAAPAPLPEARGGTIEDRPDNIIYF